MKVESIGVGVDEDWAAYNPTFGIRGRAFDPVRLSSTCCSRDTRTTATASGLTSTLATPAEWLRASASDRMRLRPVAEVGFWL